MGFSETESTKCRRHPNPKQLPGVCSSCLRDKLSKLSISNYSSSFNKNTNFSFSTSSSASSSSATAASTRGIAVKSTGHQRNGSEVAYVSVGLVLNDGLKKSRSVSCAPLAGRSGRYKLMGGKIIVSSSNNNRNNNLNDGEKENEKSKKKGGFLKKLIHTTSKKTRGAKTIIDRSFRSLTVTGDT